MGLQEQFVQAVSRSVSSLFGTMIPLNVVQQINGQDTQEVCSELVGTIEIEGGLTGSISVALSYALAIEMASLLLEEELEGVSEDVYEAVAEITNMIAGGIKTSMSAGPDLFSIGLPQVFDLGNSSDYSIDANSAIRVPIVTDKGTFAIFSQFSSLGHA